MHAFDAGRLAVSRHQRERAVRGTANHDLIAALEFDLLVAIGLLPDLAVFECHDEFAGGAPLARLRALHVQRDPLYRSVADITLETGAQSVQALARELIERLETEWKASA